MHSQTKRILLTTPDHPSEKVGGLSTFCENLEEVLCSLNYEYELFIWKNLTEIKNKDYSKYELVINVHYLPSLYIKDVEYINFIHGGELCLYSPNLIKRVYKKIMRRKIGNCIRGAKYNIFISEFSFNFFSSIYGRESYARDLIFHNCIKTNNEKGELKGFDEPLKLCCFVRDVPHKNIAGTIKFAEKLNALHPHGCRLYLTSESIKHDLVENIANISNEKREQIYKDSHLNLLFSLDHSRQGQFEGFGLTVLEAGKYGVPSIGMNACGLKDSIHHKETGWLFESNDFPDFPTFYKWLIEENKELQKRTHKHTHEGHSLERWQDLMEQLI